MKERDYASALLAGIDSITARVAHDMGRDGANSTSMDSGVAGAVPMDFLSDSDGLPMTEHVPSGFPWMMSGMVLGGLGLFGAGVRGVFYVRRYHKRKCPKCGKQMQRLSLHVAEVRGEAGQY